MAQLRRSFVPELPTDPDRSKGLRKFAQAAGFSLLDKDHADLIYKFILDHDLKNLTLIGNSFGGALSLLLSIMLLENEPGRLRSLVLIDAGAYKEYIPGYVKLLGIDSRRGGNLSDAGQVHGQEHSQDGLLRP